MTEEKRKRKKSKSKDKNKPKVSFISSNLGIIFESEGRLLIFTFPTRRELRYKRNIQA
jgi:hypothetical protein